MDIVGLALYAIGAVVGVGGGILLAHSVIGGRKRKSLTINFNSGSRMHLRNRLPKGAAISLYLEPYGDQTREEVVMFDGRRWVQKSDVLITPDGLKHPEE